MRKKDESLFYFSDPEELETVQFNCYISTWSSNIDTCPTETETEPITKPCYGPFSPNQDPQGATCKRQSGYSCVKVTLIINNLKITLYLKKQLIYF